MEGFMWPVIVAAIVFLLFKTAVCIWILEDAEKRGANSSAWLLFAVVASIPAMILWLVKRDDARRKRVDKLSVPSIAFTFLGALGLAMLIFLIPVFVMLLGMPLDDWASFEEKAYSTWFIFISVVVQDVILVAIIYKYILKPRVLTKRNIGLHWKDIDRNVLIGLGFGVALLLIVLAVDFIIVELAGLAEETNVPGMSNHTDFALILVMSAVLAPIAMTTMFLAYSIPALERRSLERRTNSQDVLDTTSMLIPLPPRRPKTSA